MLNFDFRRTNRKCSKSDRLLQPGEEFFSALVDFGGEPQRLDFSNESWSGPPENCLGWWKSNIPDMEKGKIYWVPRRVLLAYFDLVREQSDQADVAYMMGLLLAQKKILSVVDSIHGPVGEQLQLFNRRDNLHYEIPIVEISPERLRQIQAELSERLFTDQPFESEGELELAEDF